MRPRILILYGTTDGHTGKIAGAIGNTLRAEGADVALVHAQSTTPTTSLPSPDDFTGVIVAASIHTSGYQRSVLRWVKTHAPTLADRPTAFVTVCLGVLDRTAAADAELASIMEDFFERTGWSPTMRKMIAGALPYTQYGWLKRLVVRRIVGRAYGNADPTRDHEFTDWNDVRAFGRTFCRVTEGAEPARLAV